MGKRTIGGRMIVWEGNVPIPTNAPIVLTKQGLADLPLQALSLPYNGDVDKETGEILVEERFLGMAMGEVAVIREVEKAARGDSDALHKLLDRTLGKPKQSVEALNVSVSFMDYLDQLAQANPEIAKNGSTKLSSSLKTIEIEAKQKTNSAIGENQFYDVLDGL